MIEIKKVNTSMFLRSHSRNTIPTTHPKEWTQEHHYGAIYCGQSCPCCRSKHQEIMGSCPICNQCLSIYDRWADPP